MTSFDTKHGVLGAFLGEWSLFDCKADRWLPYQLR